ncbi:MAG: hypothetical protein RLZZ117_1531 [Cyanobacteriota bacterium]
MTTADEVRWDAGANAKDEGILLMGWDGVQPEGLHGLAGFVSLDWKTPAAAAGLILERLARNAGKPRDWYRRQPDALMEGPPLRSARSAADGGGSALVIRSFAPMGPDPAGLSLPPLDLTDLFNDREPIHDAVWLRAIPERIQAALLEFARWPMPLELALHTHLSIAWHLGTQLTAKRGFIVRLRQRGQAGEELWEGATPEEPPENCRWQRSELACACRCGARDPDPGAADSSPAPFCAPGTESTRDRQGFRGVLVGGGLDPRCGPRRAGGPAPADPSLRGVSGRHGLSAQPAGGCPWPHHRLRIPLPATRPLLQTWHGFLSNGLPRPSSFLGLQWLWQLVLLGA